MTAQEARSVRVVRTMTGWDEEKALDFVRVFYWHVRQYPGGTEGLIRAIRNGSFVTGEK